MRPYRPRSNPAEIVLQRVDHQCLAGKLNRELADLFAQLPIVTHDGPYYLRVLR